jgi:hypothetical protein
MPDLETIAAMTLIAGTAFGAGAIAGGAVLGYLQRKVGRKLGYDDALEKVHTALDDMGLIEVYNRLILKLGAKNSSDDTSVEEIKYVAKQIVELNRHGEKGEIEATISDLEIKDGYISGKCYDVSCPEGRIFSIDMQSDLEDFPMDPMQKAYTSNFLKGLTTDTVTLGVVFNKKYNGLAVDYLLTPQGKVTFNSSSWLYQEA